MNNQTKALGLSALLLASTAASATATTDQVELVPVDAQAVQKMRMGAYLPNGKFDPYLGEDGTYKLRELLDIYDSGILNCSRKDRVLDLLIVISEKLKKDPIWEKQFAKFSVTFSVAVGKCDGNDTQGGMAAAQASAESNAQAIRDIRDSFKQQQLQKQSNNQALTSAQDLTLEIADALKNSNDITIDDNDITEIASTMANEIIYEVSNNVSSESKVQSTIAPVITSGGNRYNSVVFPTLPDLPAVASGCGLAIQDLELGRTVSYTIGHGVTGFGITGTIGGDTSFGFNLSNIDLNGGDCNKLQNTADKAFLAVIKKWEGDTSEEEEVTTGTFEQEVVNFTGIVYYNDRSFSTTKNEG